MKNVFQQSAILGLFLLICLGISAQNGVTLPPSGSNMKSVIKQQVGLAWVKISYGSPDVAGREGKIWGQLVPYGTTDFVAQGFGTATEGPWRAGANENTTISFSHDVLVEGEKLVAGTYGLHIIPAEEGPWTLIFSHNSTQWGSYFYTEDEDALRVEVETREAPFSEYLRFDFPVRKLDEAVAALYWENLQVPFRIQVENVADQYIAQMRKDLQSTAGFTWMGYRGAAAYCLQQGKNLEEALQWAEIALSHPFIGDKNFNTLQTKTELLYALENKEAAEESLMETLAEGTPMQVYQYGSGQAQQEKTEKAVKIFEFAAERDPDTWLSHAGLAAGYRIQGEKAKAIKHYKAAMKTAPDQWKSSLEARIKQVEEAEGR